MLVKKTYFLLGPISSTSHLVNCPISSSSISFTQADVHCFSKETNFNVIIDTVQYTFPILLYKKVR